MNMESGKNKFKKKLCKLKVKKNQIYNYFFLKKAFL